MAHAPHEDTDDELVYPGICRPSQPQPGQTFQPHTNYRFRVPNDETIYFNVTSTSARNPPRQAAPAV